MAGFHIMWWAWTFYRHENQDTLFHYRLVEPVTGRFLYLADRSCQASLLHLPTLQQLTGPNPNYHSPPTLAHFQTLIACWRVGAWAQFSRRPDHLITILSIYCGDMSLKLVQNRTLLPDWESVQLEDALNIYWDNFQEDYRSRWVNV